MLLFGSGPGYLGSLQGHGGQVLYFPYVLLFIPDLFGAQERLFSFAQGDRSTAGDQRVVTRFRICCTGLV
jgi:hypothetical protein